MKRPLLLRSMQLTLFLLCFLCTITFSQSVKPFNPSALKLEWNLVKNFSAGNPTFTAALTIHNSTNTIIPADGWKLYFSLRYHGYTLTSHNPLLQITHVSGDLFVITPLTGNPPTAPQSSLQMEYTGNGRIANFQDMPTGFFWVNNSSMNSAVDLPNPIVVKSFLPAADAGAIYKSNSVIEDINPNDLIPITPLPQHFKAGIGSFVINQQTHISAAVLFSKEANYLAATIHTLTGLTPPVQSTGGNIEFVINAALPAEAYRLRITEQKISIEAGDAAGAFYAMQSLKCLLPADAWSARHSSLKIRTAVIEDAPRFGYRGFMLDVSRNFRSAKEVMRILELMSLYKLNVFHLHFSDDEGWRLAIPGLPELTETGAQRGYPFNDNSKLHPSYGSGTGNKPGSGNGYYTRADFIRILKYATERHIMVIPEIESPGHAHAAVKAMEARYKRFMQRQQPDSAMQYLLSDTSDQSVYLSNQGFTDNVMNVALPSVYAFMEKVIDEIQKMYTEAGAPLTRIHVAGDETPHGSWEKSPAVAELIKSDASLHSVKGLWSYYFDRIKDMMKRRGLSMYGWQELVTGTQTADGAVQVIDPAYAKDSVWIDAWWNLYGNEDMPYKLANNGYPTVLACLDHFYFDLAYAGDFHEPGDGWVGFLDVGKILSFMPYNYYSYTKTDIRGNAYPPGFFNSKETLTPATRKNIVGIKGALWGENLISDELTEYQLLPKMLALAEKSWSTADWENETDTSLQEKKFNEAYSQFINRVGKFDLQRLVYYNGGYHYRIPTPGAIRKDGQLFANVQYPGLVIHYTSDGTEPGLKSPVYKTPIPINKTIRLKAFSKDGRSGASVKVPG